MKVSPYHTSEPETPAVYHNDDACPFGRQIKPQHKMQGTGTGRRLCDWCASQ